ncbi:MAG TPA: sigma-70 family RNA polymerase sigma factor [Terriglobales bacterium]|nr:sigma-70 family RNA polymerase sigma factor [Terriglobales bacterium]
MKWPADSVAQATEPPAEALGKSAGNANSFEELAMPLFAPLYNFAHWLTQNREEAEDLVQETYAKALKNFASFTPGTNFRAWIYRILRNTFLTSRTGMRAAATVPIEDENDEFVLPSAAADPESLLLARADQEMIRGALEQLPLRFREIILLCDLEEMSYREIAATLGIPLGTVMSRLSRARTAMRELLRRESRRASNGL